MSAGTVTTPAQPNTPYSVVARSPSVSKKKNLHAAPPNAAAHTTTSAGTAHTGGSPSTQIGVYVPAINTKIIA